MSNQENLVVINPSPKTRYMSDTKRISIHRELMQRDDVIMALDFALLQYQSRVAQITNESMAGAGHFRMLGALEFIQELITLAESQTIRPVKDTGNLIHKPTL